MGISFRSKVLSIVLVLAMALVGPVLAAGPVETSVFAVQGVAVDVTDSDAATAKNKALIEVQVRAFRMLAERIGSPEIVAAVEAMDEKTILLYLRSLSIEEESISPGRYIGKLTVRFLPDRVKALYSRYGVSVNSRQGPSFLVLPMWKTPEGWELWEDNPWRKAWVALRAEQSSIPIIVPLGDLDDTSSISPQDVLSGDEVKLESMRRRYDVQAVLVAYAEPVENGAVLAKAEGNSPLGRISFDKTYDAETGVIDDSAVLATQRFHKVMVEKYRSGAGRVAEREEGEAGAGGSDRQYLNVAVPFAGPSEWNRLRSRILSAPGIVGLDVASLGGDGAVVRLTFDVGVEEIQAKLLALGLELAQAGGTWVIQPM